jgi:hypothetical protein
MTFFQRKVCLTFSMLVYIAFLFAQFSGSPRLIITLNLNGFEALQVGLKLLFTFEIFDPLYYLYSYAFLANPLLWSAWIATWKDYRRWACTATILALVGFSPIITLHWESISRCPGYWHWICSNGIILISSLFNGKLADSDDISLTDQE